MALERGKLSNVVRVMTGATVVATRTSGKKVILNRLLLMLLGLESTQQRDRFTLLKQE